MAARFGKGSTLSIHDGFQYFGLDFRTYISPPNRKLQRYKDKRWPSYL